MKIFKIYKKGVFSYKKNKYIEWLESVISSNCKYCEACLNFVEKGLYSEGKKMCISCSVDAEIKKKRNRKGVVYEIEEFIYHIIRKLNGVLKWNNTKK